MPYVEYVVGGHVHTVHSRHLRSCISILLLHFNESILFLSRCSRGSGLVPGAWNAFHLPPTLWRCDV